MPVVREYNSVEEAAQAANNLQGRGVSEDEVFVLAHDDGMTDEVANRSDAEKVGMDETGVGTTIKNMFQSQGDKLRSKMEEIGLSSSEAEAYERKMDEGKILLICKDDSQRDYLN